MTQEGSTFKVPLTRIKNITPHNNADALEVAWVYGFQVIVSKNKYKVGDRVVYVPIDSILPHKLESKLFPEGSKIKLTNARVRQIKIRGLASQGMLIDPEDVRHVVNTDYVQDEHDIKDMLGITKYEPPTPKFQQINAGKPGLGRKQLAHPDFHSYNGIDNVKWYPDKFEDKQVIVQEKLHGTNCRVAKLPFRTNTLLKKVKKFLGLAPKYENLYGSNRVDITNASSYKGYYGEDIYGACLKKCDAFNKVKPNETVFGEIIGPKIQSGYEYGLKEHEFVIFDVKILDESTGKQTWMNPEEVEKYAKERGFKHVPVLYKGPFNLSLCKELSSGPSIFCPDEKVKEGVVIKNVEQYDIEGNKQALKMINEDYLANKNNTDHH